jgi:hypothetical protein
MQQNPTASFKDMMGIVANKWREMGAEERRYFEQLADRDRGRHDEEKNVWIDYLKQNPQAASWKKIKKYNPMPVIQ